MTLNSEQHTQGWALVTGASAGIGAEFCRQLAARGYSLVLVARREDRLRELAESLEGRHAIKCLPIALDLASPVPGTFTERDWQTHADSLHVMLHSVCELTWRLLPAMQRRQRGFVVNVASLAGLVPAAARHTLYGATKAFLIKFSESLAMENLDRGVAVSALCPGFTHSEFHDVLGTRDQVSQMPSWMWMEAADVVRYGIESVTRGPPRVIAVPGRANRFIAMLARKLPQRMALAWAQKESRRWRKQD
jgi:short-subunit dehydrogenase